MSLARIWTWAFCLPDRCAIHYTTSSTPSEQLNCRELTQISALPLFAPLLMKCRTRFNWTGSSSQGWVGLGRFWDASPQTKVVITVSGGPLWVRHNALPPRREVEKGQCHLPGFEPGPSVYRTDVLSTTPQVPRRVSNSIVESWLRSLRCPFSPRS